MTKIAVLIPFYNESDNLPLIEIVLNRLSKLNHSFKFIFCNDNSTDDTAEKLSQFMNKNNYDFEILINKKNLGHGGSLLRLSKLKKLQNFDYIFTMDFDFCYLTENLDNFFENMNEELIVIGKRSFLDEGGFRQLVTSSSELVVILKSFKFFMDTNCPIRLYSYRQFDEIWSNLPDNTLTPNILSTYLILKKNLKFKRVNLKKNKSINTSSVSWGKGFLSKKIKILAFSFKSVKQIIAFKNQK